MKDVDLRTLGEAAQGMDKKFKTVSFKLKVFKKTFDCLQYFIILEGESRL